MDAEREHREGPPPRESAAAGAVQGVAGAAVPHRHCWRRALLLVWVVVMTAVVITGVIAFLAYFFLLMR